MPVELLIGIDTGAEGAIAFMLPDGTLVDIKDMPIDKVQMGPVSSSRVSPARLLAILSGSAGGQVFIERPEGFPIVTRDKATGRSKRRPPSAQRMLAFGESFGVAVCACVASGMAVTEISPKGWKKTMSLPADKDECRRIATLKFPSFAGAFVRKKDDGRSEAALLALYGQRQIFGRSL